MPQTETWSILRLLNWTTDYLKQRGADSPRLDAEVLLAHARGCRRIDLYTAFEEEPTEAVRTSFRALVKQRAEGMPVAYLVGHREFYSLDFQVTPDVLIPRPATEYLVIALLDLLKTVPGTDSLRGLDIGTGSGIIPITTVKHAPRLHMTAVDISPAALAIAKSNAAKHQVDSRIDFVESDLLAALPDGPQFQVIASNPPYIRTDEMPTLARDVRDYEPKLALEAGPLGTEVIARLVPQAATRLLPGGTLLLEISPQIEAAVKQLITDHGGFTLGKTIKDGEGHARIVVAKGK